MPIDWTQAQTLLNTYREELANIINYLSPVWQRIQEASPAEAEVIGSRVQVPLILSRGHGFAAGSLPVIRSLGTNSAYHNFVNFFISEEFDFRVVDMEKGLRLIAMALDSRINEMKEHFERMLFGDGSGRLGIVTDATNNPTFVVRSPYVPDVTAYRLDATKLFRVGMRVDLINGATGAVRGTSVVTSIDAANKRITLESAISGAAANDYFVVSKNLNREFVGLWGIVNNATYGEIPTSADWTAYVEGGTAGNDYTLSLEVFYRFLQTAKNHMGTAYTPNLLITTPNVMAKIFSLMTNYLRVFPTDGSVTMPLGSIVIAGPFGNCEVLTSPYCPEGCIFAIDPQAFRYRWVRPFTWLSAGGGDNYLIPKVAVGEAIYMVVGWCDFAFFTLNRRAVALMRNIAIT
ncbi:MAG: hypothetical protein NZ608_07050 [candidate division WOR-3 bacterium]|nr:hypothetical protein [candidate division WOR-3 bacterium]